MVTISHTKVIGAINKVIYITYTWLRGRKCTY